MIYFVFISSSKVTVFTKSRVILTNQKEKNYWKALININIEFEVILKIKYKLTSSVSFNKKKMKQLKGWKKKEELEVKMKYLSVIRKKAIYCK